MYGTVARFRLKPGMEKKLQAFDAEMRAAKLPGLVAEFTYHMDNEPNVYYEAVVFESREAYRALADSPEQDARFRRLLELLEAEPEWHDGEIVNTMGKSS
jgi:heme-degrading monooxygenase HmoA